MNKIKVDEAVSIQSGENLDKQILNKYLKENIANFSNIEEIGQFPGGYSNLTYLLATMATKAIIENKI